MLQIYGEKSLIIIWAVVLLIWWLSSCVWHYRNRGYNQLCKVYNKIAEEKLSVHYCQTGWGSTTLRHAWPEQRRDILGSLHLLNVVGSTMLYVISDFCLEWYMLYCYSHSVWRVFPSPHLTLVGVGGQTTNVWVHLPHHLLTCEKWHHLS